MLYVADVYETEVVCSSVPVPGLSVELFCHISSQGYPQYNLTYVWLLGGNELPASERYTAPQEETLIIHVSFA